MMGVRRKVLCAYCVEGDSYIVPFLVHAHNPAIDSGNKAGEERKRRKRGLRRKKK